MRLKSRFLLFLAFASSFAETMPDLISTVNVIQKMAQDLKSSPSGYHFYHHSDSIHPGGYNANVNHGMTKIVSQLESTMIPEVNNNGKSGTYKVAGGYGFMISHDYATQQNNAEPPRMAALFEGTNVYLPSIATMKLESEKSSVPKIDARENSDSVGPGKPKGKGKGKGRGKGKAKGLDSYVGKKIYESYMEYDKVVKDGKNEPSVIPRKYYGSDSNDEKEKYVSDEGYVESNNNDRDKGGYVESEKYDGSQNYNENGNHGALRGNSDYFDDTEAGKYFTRGEYGSSSDFNDKGKDGLYERYGEIENNHEIYEPVETQNEYVNHEYPDYEGPSSMYLNFGEFKSTPEFVEARKSFLDDFFKEYKQFSDRHMTHSYFDNDHEDYDNYHGHDDAYHGDHSFADDKSFYSEDGNSEKGFFDEAELKGDHYEKGDSEKDSSFGQKKGHKKGTKTTGYRNVLHKDEFTKDHTFYEHANKNGDFDKAGHYDEHDSQSEEGHEKSGYHDSSSHDENHGKTDSHDKGYNFDDDISDHDEHGYKSHYDDNYYYNDGGDEEYESEYRDGYGDHENSEAYY